ncbi:hypothetical protein BDR26DRAFT_463743 [Obelidium mucronatum]|nr:hypothetical protein BDR26DRAFT_463743 [Obelidium mucronatum]
MQHPNSSNLSRNEEGWGQNQLSNGRLISNENDENPLGLWSTLSMNDFYCQEVAGDSINPLITPILQQSTSDLFGTKIANHSLLSTNVADSLSQTPTTLNIQLAKPEDLAAFSDDITHGLSFAPFDFLSLNGSPYTQLSKDGAVTVSSDKRPVTFDSGDTVYNPDEEIQGFYSNSLSSSIPSSPNPSSIGAVVVEVEPETGRTRKRRHLEATATTAAPKPKPNSIVGASRSEYTTIDLLPGVPLGCSRNSNPKTGFIHLSLLQYPIPKPSRRRYPLPRDMLLPRRSTSRWHIEIQRRRLPFY